ncbi:MAG: phosphatase PAP2 family protein [Bacteroidetes bacterium]|nr:MAG: phosphatase PAP2 family protein [Bacteroidota bacterium]
MIFRHTTTFFLLPRLLSGIFFLGSSTGLLMGQSPGPYRLRPAPEAAWSAAALGLTLAGRQIEQRIAPLTAPQLAALDRSRIPAFDRFASYYWSPRAARVSDYLLLGSIAAPYALSLLRKSTRSDWPQLSLMATQTFFLTYGITNLTKVAALRNRPYTYLDAAGNPDLQAAQASHDARLSFFSGHSSVSAAMCFFSARVYADYYPSSKAKPWVWAGAAVIPATTALLRVKAGKHYPSDVIAGYAIGAATGLLVPLLHRQR